MSTSKTEREDEDRLETGLPQAITQAKYADVKARAQLQGYLALKKPPPPWDHDRALGIVLL